MAKVKEGEKLDDANLEKVIALLEGDSPITKKLACELLCISYNTTRLGKLIQEYKEKKERTAKRRASLRGKAATAEEIKFAISEYLTGSAVSVIADEMYRSSDFVEKILDKHGVPKRARAHDYFKPEMVPEEAMRESFKVGEIVYSMRYDSTARVISEKKQSENVYLLWLLSEKWQQHAYQPASELASLEHLVALGVKV